MCTRILLELSMCNVWDFCSYLLAVVLKPADACISRYKLISDASRIAALSC